MNSSHLNPGLLRAQLNSLAALALAVPFLATAEVPTYPGPVYQQPASPPTGGKYQALSEKVAQIAANDQRQDVRLYQLERDVDKVSTTVAPKPPASAESGMSPAPALIPYVPYQVRKGDTLWRIAMMHKVAPGDIIGFNRMPNDTVVEGQTLMIPQKGGAPKGGTLTAAGFHTVKPGESFGSIAKKYSVSTDALTKANPKINPAKLLAGARLALPAGARTPAPKPAPNVAYDNGLPAPAPKPGNDVHIVLMGESLSVIALKHHVPLATLLKANKLTDANTVRVGQKLIVPAASGTVAKTPAPVPPPAKPGTGKGKKSPAAPPAPGSGVATAPVPPTPPVKPKPPEPPTPPPQQPTNNRGIVAYRMEKGDTIEAVAHSFGTTSAEIRRLNRLPANAPLHDGDEIIVPGMGPVAGN